MLGHFNFLIASFDDGVSTFPHSHRYEKRGFIPGLILTVINSHLLSDMGESLLVKGSSRDLLRRIPEVN